MYVVRHPIPGIALDAVVCTPYTRKKEDHTMDQDSDVIIVNLCAALNELATHVIDGKGTCWCDMALAQCHGWACSSARAAIRKAR